MPFIICNKFTTSTLQKRTLIKEICQLVLNTHVKVKGCKFKVSCKLRKD